MTVILQMTFESISLLCPQAVTHPQRVEKVETVLVMRCMNFFPFCTPRTANYVSLHAEFLPHPYEIIRPIYARGALDVVLILH